MGGVVLQRFLNLILSELFYSYSPVARFVDAVKKNDVPETEEILNQYGDKICGEIKGDALLEAVRRNHSEVLAFLLKKCDSEIDIWYKNYSLTHASRSNYSAIVEFFLENFPDIVREHQRIVLYDSVGYGRDVRHIVEQCPDFPQEDKHKVLFHAAELYRWGIVKYLLEKWSTVSANYKNYVLCKAISDNHQEIIDILLTDPDVQAKITDNNNKALRLSVEILRVEIVSKLLECFAVVQYEADKNWSIRELLKPWRSESERKILEALDKAKENLEAQSNVVDLLRILTHNSLISLTQTTLNQHPGMRALKLEIRSEEDWKTFEDKLLEWGNFPFQKQNQELSYCIGYFLNQQGKGERAIEHFSLVKPMSPLYKYAMFECANMRYVEGNHLEAFQYALLSEDSWLSEMIALSYIKSLVTQSDLTWDAYNSFPSAKHKDNRFDFLTKLNLSNFPLEDCVTLLKFNTDQIVNQWEPISDFTQLKEKLSEIKKIAELTESFASRTILSFMKKNNLRECESKVAISMHETSVIVQKREHPDKAREVDPPTKRVRY